MERKVVFLESENMDIRYAVTRVGRRVFISADSPAIARALVRRIGDAIAGQGKAGERREGDTQAIGFRAEPEE